MTFELLLKIMFENTALIASFFVIGGLVKLFVYYKLFGIYVYEFIDIKEVVTLFISNLFGYFLVIGIVALALIKFPFIESFGYLIPTVFSFLSIIYWFIRKRVFFVEVIFFNLLFWILFIVVKNLLAEAPIDPSLSEVTKNYTLVVLFLSLIIYSIANASTEFYKVKMKSYYLGTKILTKTGEIESNTRIYYIGKTDKFVFIHDSVSKSTQAIPIGEIMKIIFKKV